MKKIILGISLLAINFGIQAQTNVAIGTGGTTTASDFYYDTNTNNVGIGTSQPKTELEVNGDISMGRKRKLQFLTQTNGDRRAYITSTDEYFGALSGYSGSPDHNGLVFGVNGDKHPMIISENGQVGIGKYPSRDNLLDIKGHDAAFKLSTNNDDYYFRIATKHNNYDRLTMSFGTKKILQLKDLSYSGGMRLVLSNERGIGLSSLNNPSHLNQMDMMVVNRKVGIGKTTPFSKLHIYNNDASTGTDTGVTIEQDGVGDAKLQYFLTGGYRWVTGIDNSEGDKFVIGRGSDWTQGKDFVINTSGQIGVGTASVGTHKLAVEGTVGAREIKVEVGTWSDFVFEKTYNLPSLEEVEAHILKNGHLENIPSKEEVLENGIYLGDMNAKLLQKIEELTLYTIDQQKQLKVQNTEIEKLKNENNQVKALAAKLLELQLEIDKLKN
ncbi:hypothetical protein Q4Q34_04980 [Flavivirga abyssicola]|uniref:hypothetical protein n=1 Tax=Flavivirga abyssicola TaxID=3063533 RepID=UPI0026E017B9|nr:hypothetical protein [Flavivirga sp. MEBiC07777]WVK14380.1 hypothetical protein Q4Q34_04980 [Flavivirga sp. MEBiC07777]